MHVPVLIVGGGGCGLSASVFLSDLGVSHLLVEKHDGTAQLPKAGSYTLRTMEIFRQHGLADEIYRLGPDPQRVRNVAFYTSIGGDGPLDRQRLHTAPFMGFDGSSKRTHERDSPARCAILPQWHLEPMLQQAAEKRNPGNVRFGHKLIRFEQRDGLVEAQIRDQTTGKAFTVTADYVVAADGGRTIGPQLGVRLQGQQGLADMVSIIFRADLSDLLPEDDVMIWFFVNPEGGPYSSGVLVPFASSPDKWGLQTDTWRINVRFPVGDPRANLDESTAGDIVRELLHVSSDAAPEIEIAKISHWTLEAVLADRFQDGRFLFAGDAAHRQPPTTGMGLNSAIQDAHNLAWKLAGVVHGWAPPSLLATYEAERRPVDAHQVEFALFTFNNLGRTFLAGLGIGAEMSLEQRRQSFVELLSDTTIGRTRRALMKEVWETQRMEFDPHDIDLGYTYPEWGAVAPDGSEPTPRDPMGVVYQPSTRPGGRLPHAWLRRDAVLVSTHDAVPVGHFGLFIGVDGQPWVEAARILSERTGIQVHVVQVGGDNGLVDVDGAWGRVRGVSEAGAVLTRPDGFVAWRAVAASGSHEQDLADAFAQILHLEPRESLASVSASLGGLI